MRFTTRTLKNLHLTCGEKGNFHFTEMYINKARALFYKKKKA